MNLTLSVDDDVVKKARRHAKAMGKTVNELVREYLERIAGNSDLKAAVAEFRELSRNPTGNSVSWKFNREEIQRKIR
jgi:hypothetical protein